MHSFKPLLNHGHVEEQPKVKIEHGPVLHDAQAKTLDLPDFTDEAAQPQPPEAQAAGQTDGPVDYDLPDMGGNEAPSEELHVRKHADSKNKIFMPMLTNDPDEDPVEAARQYAEQMVRDATSQAEELKSQAETMLKEAHEGVAHIIEEANQLNQQANARIEEAKQEAPAIKEAAREEGFNAGHQDGMEQGMVAGQARLEALMADFSQAVKNIAKARDDVAKALTPEIVALVEACLDKVFLTANSVDAGLVAQVVNNAISRLDEHSQISVRLNPGNLEHVPKLAPAMWAKMQAMKNISWVPDPDLRPGDCIVDTPITQIDATVQTRRQRLFAQLEDTLQQGNQLDLEAILSEAAEKRAASQLATMPVEPSAEPTTETQINEAPLTSAENDITLQAEDSNKQEDSEAGVQEDDPWADQAADLDDDW